MSRLPDWLARLNAIVESASAEPLVLGRFDCAIFAARGVDAQTGSTWEADLRALYCGTASAARFLRREGGLEAAVTLRLGQPRPWWKAMRGDVCLLPGEDGDTVLGLNMGETIAALTPTGVRYAHLYEALKTWRVG